MKPFAAVPPIFFACFLPLKVAAIVDSVAFNFGQFKDISPPSGPGINNIGPLFSPTIGSAALSDYQVTLLNDATVFGLPRPVDGISLRRAIDRVDIMPGGMIPPTTFNQRVDIVLVTEDLSLFGPGATLADWNSPFPLGAGSRMQFSQSESHWSGGGGVFGNPLGGTVTTAFGYEAEIQSFTVTQVPEPSTLALGICGCLAALGWASLGRKSKAERSFTYPADPAQPPS